MRSNALSWFLLSFLLASEGYDLYIFDIRKLSVQTQIYKAHVAAVMSCDWSPIGLEFVNGGWKEGKGTTPEVYHTKRMQRVSSSIFSADARFVLSGSDDGKARASDKLGVITARERAAMEYRDSLKERWKIDAQVGKVSRTRHTETCTPGLEAQANNVGGEKSQGGAQAETHPDRGMKTEGREMGVAIAEQP